MVALEAEVRKIYARVWGLVTETRFTCMDPGFYTYDIPGRLEDD